MGKKRLFSYHIKQSIKWERGRGLLRFADLHLTSSTVEMERKRASVGKLESQLTRAVLCLLQTHTERMADAVSAGHDDRFALWRSNLKGGVNTLGSMFGVKLLGLMVGHVSREGNVLRRQRSEPFVVDLSSSVALIRGEMIA